MSAASSCGSRSPEISALLPNFSFARLLATDLNARAFPSSSIASFDPPFDLSFALARVSRRRHAYPDTRFVSRHALPLPAALPLRARSLANIILADADADVIIAIPTSIPARASRERARTNRRAYLLPTTSRTRALVRPHDAFDASSRIDRSPPTWTDYRPSATVAPRRASSTLDDSTRRARERSRAIPVDRDRSTRRAGSSRCVSTGRSIGRSMSTVCR